MPSICLPHRNLGFMYLLTALLKSKDNAVLYFLTGSGSEHKDDTKRPWISAESEVGQKTGVMYACEKEQEPLTAEPGGSLFPTEMPESSTINRSRPFSLLPENLQFSGAPTLNHSAGSRCITSSDCDSVPGRAAAALQSHLPREKTLFPSNLLRGNSRAIKNAA